MIPLDALPVQAWTDYPFVQLGDVPGRPAPIRCVVVTGYDGDKYATVNLPDGQTTEIKAAYLHATPGEAK